MRWDSCLTYFSSFKMPAWIDFFWVLYLSVAYDLAKEVVETPPERRHSITVCETPTSPTCPKVRYKMFFYTTLCSPCCMMYEWNGNENVLFICVYLHATSRLLELCVVFPVALDIASQPDPNNVDRRHSITVCESPTSEGPARPPKHLPLGSHTNSVSIMLLKP